MRKLWKIHIGLIISFFIAFFSNLCLVIFSNEEINAYYPIALLLTYMYLIINFLKDDFLSKEFKEKAKLELNSHDYINVMIYRGIIYFVSSVCIIIAPLMWAMAIITN